MKPVIKLATLIIIFLSAQTLSAVKNEKIIDITTGINTYLFSDKRESEFIPFLKGSLSKGMWGTTATYQFHINHTLVSNTETITPEIHTAGLDLKAGMNKPFSCCLKGKTEWGENNYSALSGGIELSASIKDFIFTGEGSASKILYMNEKLEERTVSFFIQYNMNRDSSIDLMACKSNTGFSSSENYDSTFFRLGASVSHLDSFFFSAGGLYGYDNMDNSIPGFDVNIACMFENGTGLSFAYQFTCYIQGDKDREEEKVSTSDLIYSMISGSCYTIPAEQNDPTSYHQLNISCWQSF